MQAILGQKKSQTQKFLENGTRIPVTVVSVGGNVVMQVKTQETDKYTSVQLGFGTKKHANKPLLGHTKKAGVEKAPRILHEVRLADVDADASVLPEMGITLAVADILKPGDMIKVTGKAKGKGFAGVVKRHHFRGGPRTHGQSDRERAPGSIGQTTTPGRVYRGKRMAGHMGDGQATVSNLQVVDVNPKTDEVLIKGLIPGGVKSVVIIEKTGEAKNFVPLIGAYQEEVAVTDVPEETAAEETAAEPVEVKLDEAPVEETAAAEPETANEAEVSGKDIEAQAASAEEASATEETKTADETEKAEEK